ncbi:2-hydroxyacid dehydrogenase family protein [Secundilactobacillus similis]|jgi:D-3-phosphoglycerate dehydrogenase|uniref:Glyoxylate reductase n=1 Tax=Secundilactobacillus similis DSM 23365 = JCM 2765 TaxID=1423804 RepID=A0A0R2F6R5_9LACO|nr:2-hydroxyacid dehydrogenase family protein [Secundilactobacillus similis]KRN21207.1 glyoxylate reductase [Secundilactobacillus similis DSM 23365 = JCM 2765]
MSKVYLSAKLPEVATKTLTDAGLDVSVFAGDGLISHEELLKNVTDADFLITPLSTKVDKAIIDAAPKLKLIANFGAGFNNIDTAYAKEKGIPVTNTPAVSTNAVAEVTIGLILALSHRIVEGDQKMRHEGFPGWAPLYFLGHEIAGKTLGVVGLGNIGSDVARKANALGMNVQYYKPNRLSDPEERSMKVKYVSLDELIKTSDYISINAPQTADNHHQFDADAFKAMKSTASIINVGRGPIIDEAALLDALKAGEIAGAALDVYEKEPEVDDGFKTLKNVILTPHVGNATVEARDAMANIVAGNVVLVNKGEAAKFIVNK